MSKYRLLADHWIAGPGTGSGFIISAGTVAATADAGGILPSGWVPTGSVDPLDGPAVNALWAAGPQPPYSSAGSFSVGPPLTYWKLSDAARDLWALTGLGSALAPQSMTRGRL